MIDATVIWDLEDDPEGNVQHLAEHGITVEVATMECSREVRFLSGRTAPILHWDGSRVRKKPSGPAGIRL